ncbi:MAG: hypothetical protein EBY16_01545 [Gammaproteobacteria bacterium]|nr:hypothetical protein [Gammaproteobacteria bacterium]
MHNQTELTDFQSYSIGAITGLVDVLATHPFFVMKTHVQQGLPIPWNLKSLYKGAGTNALGFVPITSIQIGTSQWVEKHWFFGQPTYTQKILASFSAGALSSLISCPIEKFMILQHRLPHLSIGKILTYQQQSEGLKGLFSGQIATLLREGSFSVFLLMVPPVLKAEVYQYTQHETSSALIAGVASGVGATLVSQPLDTIKTIQQSSSSPFGFFKTARDLGLEALFKGTLSRGSSVVLSITLMSMLKEQLENWCKAYHQPQPRP